MLMEVERPKNIIEYKKWLKESHQVEISKRTETYYDAVTSIIASEFESSDFWQSLSLGLEELNQKFYVTTSYYLFVNPSVPKLLTKKFAPFLLKTYRQNVVNNGNWPDPPSSGWVLPNNWYCQINDTVRTCFVVKFLDGVKYLTEHFADRAEETSYESRVDFEAKEEGYYAAHFYIKFPCEVPRENWDTIKEIISVEIQVTTQLQEILRRLLHKYYERRRTELRTPDVKWQWDYKSDEFATNYLGHILHYVEGMIMDIRDKKNGKETIHEG